MTSLVRGRKFGVHVLHRSKFNGREIFAEDDCSTGGTEATLKQRKDDVYVMEISERGTSKIVLEMDFRKIKSYTMRTRCWHEVKHDGRLIALHFTEPKEFDDFYLALEQVLRIHRKFTKPKNDETFLREVEMFQLKALRSTEKGRGGGRTVQSASTEQERGGRSVASGTAQPDRPRITKPAKSLNIFERLRQNRLPEPVDTKNQVEKNTKNPPPPARQKPRSTSEATGGPSNSRPTPRQLPPPRVPPPRTNVDPGSWRTSDSPSTSEEDDENSSKYSEGATYNKADDDDDEAFEGSLPPSPPPSPPPMRTSSSSTNSSSASEPSLTGDSRPQTKPKPTRKITEPSPLSPPSVGRAAKQDTSNHHRSSCDDDDATTSGALSPTRHALAASKDKPVGRQLPPPPDKSRKPPKKEPTHEDRPRPHKQPCPVHQSTPAAAPPSPPTAERPQLQPKHPPLPPPPSSVPAPPSSSSLYGTAMQWICPQCTLRNDFRCMDCVVCAWMRTDAWKCIGGCEIVYSNDVPRCFVCPVWRCRLCTHLNTGEEGESTVCHVCEQ